MSVGTEDDNDSNIDDGGMWLSATTEEWKNVLGEDGSEMPKS